MGKVSGSVHLLLKGRPPTWGGGAPAGKGSIPTNLRCWIEDYLGERVSRSQLESTCVLGHNDLRAVFSVHVDQAVATSFASKQS